METRLTSHYSFKKRWVPKSIGLKGGDREDFKGNRSNRHTDKRLGIDWCVDTDKYSPLDGNTLCVWKSHFCGCWSSNSRCLGRMS